jgi:hypothetical protein
MHDHERHKQVTGGFIAPVAFMHYDDHGRCVATSPEGGLTVLDQFAIGAMQSLVEYHRSKGPLTVASIDHAVSEAYRVAQTMLARKRQIEKGEG